MKTPSFKDKRQHVAGRLLRSKEGKVVGRPLLSKHAYAQ
jgi:hypothetical protein